MPSIQQRYPAIPTFDAAMLSRAYPDIDALMAQAQQAVDGLSFHGLVLHATPMANVVGYGFGIGGHEDGRWFSSGELIHIGALGPYTFVEDAMGRRLLMISTAGEHGVKCLDHKQRHLAVNAGYFQGVRHAVFGLLQREDVATIRNALTAYVDSGMGDSANRPFVIQQKATACPTGEGAALDAGEVRALAQKFNPDTELNFDGIEINLAHLELATIDAALHCLLDAGQQADRDRPVQNQDEEGVLRLMFHIQVCMKRKAGSAQQ